MAPITLTLPGARGTQTTFEDPEHAVAIEPLRVAYRCPRCHGESVVPMHPEADVPATWPCRTCPATASITDPELVRGENTPGRSATPQRTAWDMLCERRTPAELEVLLARRVALLRDDPAAFYAGQTDREATVSP